MGAEGSARVIQGAGVVAGTAALHLPSLALAGIVAMYACSLLYRAARVAWGLWQTALLRRSAVAIRLTHRFVKAGVPIAISSTISSPSTIGFRKPILLLPPDFLGCVDKTGAGCRARA